MISVLQELQQKRDQILQAATKHGLCNIRVFGSVARGEDHANSDIDLLVDLQRPVKDAFAFLDFQQEVSALCNGKKVDIVFETGLYHAVKSHILEEAKPL